MTSPSVSERIITQPQHECQWSLAATRGQCNSSNFIFLLPFSDHTEILHPSDKVAPPPDVLLREEIGSETCQSEEPFTQSVGGLSEVPPLPAFYSGSCSCQAPPERPGELHSSPSGRLAGLALPRANVVTVSLMVLSCVPGATVKILVLLVLFLTTVAMLSR